ncbi:hypothetical protein [Paraburkholderia fungorum]|uniref:Uncharacterized protein n=1 Tax=Paraburkholderia fungorum TaxID=134537 RepID=A0AAW3V030_9BURK|nr:hypothetical protein [Paraburkholderia fungorum]MBB4517211.1 hypothetical protein [Paraburkholderia fungorum]MBB6204279.1 hypothetical protein [Paraburkholderia fungorum]
MLTNNNRFTYDISLAPGSTYAPPSEEEVKAKIQEWPELSRSDAETELVLERFLHSLLAGLESDDARIESALLEGGRLHVTLHAPIGEETADRLVTQHAEKLGFNHLKLPELTVIHPFNKPGPGTTFH